MDKKYSLLFAFLITLLILINFLLIKTLNKNLETVKISRIIDGDTIELEDGRKIRLANVNTPEKNQPNYNLSIIFLNQLLNSSVELEILGTEKYGRILGRIYTPDYLNLELVKKGLASKFLVDKSELNKFTSAEQEAIENSLGIWQKSQYFGCFESEINPEQETVKLSNKCNKVNISSWFIKDESTKRYEFNGIEIEKISLNTHEGKDNETDIFWNSKQNIWNNDRDTLYLFDVNGKIVQYDSYGY